MEEIKKIIKINNEKIFFVDIYYDKYISSGGTKNYILHIYINNIKDKIRTVVEAKKRGEKIYFSVISRVANKKVEEQEAEEISCKIDCGFNVKFFEKYVNLHFLKHEVIVSFLSEVFSKKIIDLGGGKDGRM